MSNVDDNCKLVVFADKAWNAIVSETLRKDPVETGGILLGHILSNGYWVVMEVLPPGMNSVHQKAYFEYDANFVNYLANAVSGQYKVELSVLGLWHRHPGSMDVFSGTDDGTNATFAQMNQYGAISGLVNIDPKFRFTLRHVSYPLHYKIVNVEVGDDLIPPQYFELKYRYGDNTVVMGKESQVRIAEPERERPSKADSPLAKCSPQSEEGIFSDIRPIIKRLGPFAIVALLSLGIGLWIGGQKKTGSSSESKAITTERSNTGINRGSSSDEPKDSASTTGINSGSSFAEPKDSAVSGEKANSRGGKITEPKNNATLKTVQPTTK